MTGKVASTPDGLVPKWDAAKVRSALAGDLLDVICEAYKEDRVLDDAEMKFVTDALLWISWHAGRTSGMKLAEGIQLHEVGVEDYFI